MFVNSPSNQPSSESRGGRQRPQGPPWLTGNEVMDAGEAQGVGHLDLTKRKAYVLLYVHMHVFLYVSIIDNLLEMGSILMYMYIVMLCIYIIPLQFQK